MRDILIEQGDLFFDRGDFAAGDGTEQAIASVIELQKGELRYAPLLGAGIRREILNEASDVAIKQEVQKNLEIDGFNVVSVRISSDGLRVEGYY